MNPSFRLGELDLSRIWHCFGNYMHRVDLHTVVAMLTASGSNVVPINTHALTRDVGREGLQIGFGGVRFDDLAKRIAIGRYVVMLNINHQTDVFAAVRQTLLAHELTGEKVIKLEVLDVHLKRSNDALLLAAVRELRQISPALALMPLLSNREETAKELVDLGCPLLRVMGSDIGSGRGIVDLNEFGRICRLPVPVVLDGGVRSPDDFAAAMQLGAQGCLINSALFEADDAPEVELAGFVRGCAKYMPRQGMTDHLDAT